MILLEVTICNMWSTIVDSWCYRKSVMLSLVLKRLRIDWQLHYGLEPWLAETLVDQQRYHGGCYRAANWLDLGETSGRGRMDQSHQRHGAQVKTVLIYPLVKKAATKLRQRRVEQ